MKNKKIVHCCVLNTLFHIVNFGVDVQYSIVNVIYATVYCIAICFIKDKKVETSLFCALFALNEMNCELYEESICQIVENNMFDIINFVSYCYYCVLTNKKRRNCLAS